MPLRVYLAGTVAIEGELGLVREPEFPGRQGRLAFAYLVCASARPVRRDELANVLWSGELPPAWEVGLSAIASKLRALLARSGVERERLGTAFGCYQLRLPDDAWVDLLAAPIYLTEAEAALHRGDRPSAYAWALVASAIARRPFLEEEQGEWVEQRRTQLREELVRALELVCDHRLEEGNPFAAAATASEILEVDPFRESAYQRLMRAHAASGNRAEALLAYERCRKLLADELGAEPALATQEVYREVAR